MTIHAFLLDRRVLIVDITPPDVEKQTEEKRIYRR